jgi:antirestriction protein ArdC
MTAATINADFESQPSANYIASWLGVARRDVRAVFTVASAAQRAADLILGPRLGDVEPPAEDAAPDSLATGGVEDVALELAATA